MAGCCTVETPGRGFASPQPSSQCRSGSTKSASLAVSSSRSLIATVVETPPIASTNPEPGGRL